MPQRILDWVLASTDATRVEVVQSVQTLWSGFGEIVRLRVVRRGHDACLILKHVAPPQQIQHPRGWDTDRSRERKLRSYAIEKAFYDRYAPGCRAARMPGCVGTDDADGGWSFLLEDLDAAGFAGRRGKPAPIELDRCLAWLAGFHGSFLGRKPEGLWAEGTYWHLATRPDELAAVSDPRLRAAAPLLDQRLRECRFRTLVHGDAKVANFCFAADGSVAAVDYQYVGGGCGIKDVAYFLSSCLTDEECATDSPRYLDLYFGHLREELAGRAVDVDALESEWRSLYPIAWADFYRFLAGWSPDHWKIHGYSDRVTQSVLDDLGV